MHQSQCWTVLLVLQVLKECHAKLICFTYVPLLGVQLHHLQLRALAFVQLRPTRCDSHSQLIQLIDAIISNQQYGQPFTDASENVHWLIVLAWVRLPCGKHQCTCQGCHDSKEVKEVKPAEYYKAHHNNICTGAACKCYCRL